MDLMTGVLQHTQSDQSEYKPLCQSSRTSSRTINRVLGLVSCFRNCRCFVGIKMSSGTGSCRTFPYACSNRPEGEQRTAQAAFAALRRAHLQASCRDLGFAESGLQPTNLT
jgi:hypothetical protein